MDDDHSLFMEGDVRSCLKAMDLGIDRAFSQEQSGWVEEEWFQGRRITVRVAGYDMMARQYLTPGPLGLNINDNITRVGDFAIPEFISYFFMNKNFNFLTIILPLTHPR